MRQQRSIWFLLIRSTFRHVLAVVLALMLVQGGLFWFAMSRDWAYAEESAEWAVESGRLTENDPAWYVSAPEEILRKSGAPVAAGIALTGLVVALMSSGMERKSKVSYTFRRLSVSEKEVCLWQALYNGMCLLLFWALEVLAVLALCKWYTLWVGPEGASHQTVFLTCYRSNFLHNLFPLEDGMLWVRNALLCLMMGTAAAAETYDQRRAGKMSGKPIIASGVAWWTFLEGGSKFGYLLVSVAGSLFIIAAVMIRILREEDKPRENA